MNDRAAGYDRAASIAAVLAGLSGLLYSVSFVLVSRAAPAAGAGLAAAFLLLGALLGAGPGGAGPGLRRAAGPRLPGPADRARPVEPAGPCPGGAGGVRRQPRLVRLARPGAARPPRVGVNGRAPPVRGRGHAGDPG